MVFLSCSTEHVQDLTIPHLPPLWLMDAFMQCLFLSPSDLSCKYGRYSCAFFLFLKRMAFLLYYLHFVMLLWFTHRFPQFGKEAVCENKNGKKKLLKTVFYIRREEMFQSESIRLCT